MISEDEKYTQNTGGINFTITIINDRNTMSQKIALVGGGTGGHIVPILSLIANLSLPMESFIWIGGDRSMEQEKAQNAGVRFIPITTYKLTSTRSIGVLLYPFKLLKGIWEARTVLRQEQPKLVFSK